MIQLNSLRQRLFLSCSCALAGLLVLFLFLDQIQLSQFTKIIILVSMTGLTLFGLHLVFSKYFLRPVFHLIQIAKELANSNNSQIRAQKLNDDELGNLVEAFNEMMNQIQLREEIILSERDRASIALEQADNFAKETKATNQKLALEVKFRKDIESKLTDFQQFLNSIIDSMPSALIAIDEHLNITQWNQEAAKLSGTSSSDATGQYAPNCFELLQPYSAWISAVWTNNKTQSLHDICHVVNDHNVHFDITVYPLKNAQSRSAVIRIDDVTEKIRLEEALVQSEKIISLGGMAAGMAHEINNPICGIVQNVQNIVRRIDPNLPANQNCAKKCHISLEALNTYLEERKINTFLNNISTSGMRASNLVTNMLQFSRVSDQNLYPCHIVEVLKKAINIALTDDLLHDIRDNFKLNFVQEFKQPSAIAPGVFNELEQVLLNLIKNAAYAIHERKLKFDDIDSGIITIYQSIHNNKNLIRISDNGIGMEETVRKRVFEPFFTTKDVGHGTGLGLSVSYFIISSHHHGTMLVDSKLGVGTTFEIQLPLLSQESSNELPLDKNIHPTG